MASLLGSKCSKSMIGTTTRPVGFFSPEVVLSVLNIHNVQYYAVIHIIVEVFYFFQGTCNTEDFIVAKVLLFYLDGS